MSFIGDLGKSIGDFGRSIERNAEIRERRAHIQECARICTELVSPHNELNLLAAFKENIRHLMLKPISGGLNDPSWIVVPSTVDINDLIHGAGLFCYNSPTHEPANEIKNRLTPHKVFARDSDCQLVHVTELSARKVMIVHVTNSRRAKFILADERGDFESTNDAIQRVSFYWVWVDSPTYLIAYLTATDVWSLTVKRNPERFNSDVSNGCRKYDVDAPSTYFYAEVSIGGAGGAYYSNGSPIGGKTRRPTSDGFFYFTGDLCWERY